MKTLRVSDDGEYTAGVVARVTVRYREELQYGCGLKFRKNRSKMGEMERGGT
jgi:hypothetical protein